MDTTAKTKKINENRENLVALSFKAREDIKLLKDFNIVPAWSQNCYKNDILEKPLNFSLRLIYNSQKPELQNMQLKSFKQWKNEGYTILKGAKALTFWAQPKNNKNYISTETGEKVNFKSVTDENNSDYTTEEYKYFPISYLFAENQVYKRDASVIDAREVEKDVYVNENCVII